MMKRSGSSSSSDSNRSSPVYRRNRSGSAPSSSGRSSKRKTSHDCIRLVVVGDQGVGKSALTVRLLTKRFIGTYQKEKDMVYKSKQQVPNTDETAKNLRLEILDTTCANLSDDESPASVVDRLYWSSAIVIVYDITNFQSFQYASDILSDIKREKPNHACLLLGNKTDLEHQREVRLSEVTKLTISYPNCLNAEVSAATSDHVNVASAFQHICTLSHSVTSKSGVKRRRSIVDMAKAFSTLLRSGTTKHPESRTSS